MSIWNTSDPQAATNTDLAAYDQMATASGDTGAGTLNNILGVIGSLGNAAATTFTAVNQSNNAAQAQAALNQTAQQKAGAANSFLTSPMGIFAVLGVVAVLVVFLLRRK